MIDPADTRLVLGLGLSASAQCAARADPLRPVQDVMMKAIRSSTGTGVSHPPDRQPRRDRLPRHPHRAAHGPAHGRGLFRGRRRRAACRDGGRGRPARSGAGARQLPEHRARPRGGAADRRGGGASRLRLSVRECRIRRGLRRGGPGLRRSDRRDDDGDGLEVRLQGADGKGRRAAGARLSRRGAGRRDAGRGGRQDRLSGAGQGVRRRRRARHARGARGRRTWPPRSSAPSARPRPRSATTAC